MEEKELIIKSDDDETAHEGASLVQPSKSGSGDKTHHIPQFKWETAVIIALLLIVLLAAFFRFTGLDWDASYHLHPDERFLTDVAGQLQTTDPITYLKTSESPLNPYNVGKNFYVYGNFPMTVTRFVAEWVDGICQNVDDLCSERFIFYDGIHLVGRFLSGLVDLASIVFIFLIGRRLYDWRVGLLGALLLAAAVLPIQQSHFFTMDTWAAALATITIYMAVRASQNGARKLWWVLFGIGLGLTTASRINLAPLAVMAGVAAIVWLAKRAEKSQQGQGWRYLISPLGKVDLQRALVGLLIAAIVSIVVFRLAQPYAFADAQIARDQVIVATGQPPSAIGVVIRSLVGFNQDWLDNMAEIQGLQSPEASFPPALQWTDRTPILFPLINIIFWGMGIAAGIAALAGFFWALWRVVNARPDWAAHVMIVSWTGLYFLFMATRWVKSIRYFLPVYPFFLLLAAWALVELWNRAGENRWKQVGAASLMVIIVAPTLIWANEFVNIYRHPVTRVEASEWIFDNVPSGATLIYETNGYERELQLPLRRYDFQPGISGPLFLNFELPEDGIVKAIRFNYLSDPDIELVDDDGETLQLSVIDTANSQVLSEVEQVLNLTNERQEVRFDLPDVPLVAGIGYTVMAEVESGGPIKAGTSIIANEHWDDALPVRLEGRDPFSAYYDGITGGQIPITNPDSEEKRQSFYGWLEESDYIVLSSQRALWSLPRLPLTYPLTNRYYEALFSGELGFELVEQFHAIHEIGPFNISDVGGTAAIGSQPEIGWPPPGILAAEEAFSVYDHPPVWIFEKTDAYSLENAQQVLDSVDLSQVMFMTPGEATRATNGLMLDELARQSQKANGTFNQLFNLDGLLNENPWLAAIVWWIAVILLGAITFPIAFIVFRGLPDRGYPLARILSLLLISYFVWSLASLELLPHTRAVITLGLFLLAITSIGMAIVRREEIFDFLRHNLKLIGFVELFSLALFLLFILIRLGNPDAWDVIWGGEKPMDLSYFSAVLKSTEFPPYDPWFAGGYINYYYYGFVYVGSLTKLLGIVPSLAYNLIVPMLFSFTGLGAFSIAYNLVKRAELRNRRTTLVEEKRGATGKFSSFSRRAAMAGLVAAALCVLLGNLAEVGVVLNTWHKASDSTVNTGVLALDTVVRTFDGGLDLAFSDRPAPIYPGDWFWTATRAIPVEQGETQPITEFPFFTFLYGDLHAHMIALPLTLLALAWAISLALQIGLEKEEGQPKKRHWETWVRWGIGALAIGVLWATNTWDFPTYMAVGILAVLYYAYRQHDRIDLKMVGQAVFQSALLVILAVALFLPFTSNYGTAYNSFLLWYGSYTQFWAYLVIYGLFLLFIITHLILEFRSWTSSWTRESLSRWEPFVIPVLLGLSLYVLLLVFLLYKTLWIGPVVLSLIILAGILAIRPNLPAERRIVLILMTISLTLTLFVDIIYLEGDIGRMNTVFKFYMQVWVMLSVACGAAAIWTYQSIKSRKRVRIAWQVALALLLAAALLYPLLATKAKWDIRMSEDGPTTLDGMAFMEVTNYAVSGYDGTSQTISLKDDYEAIQWIQRNIEGSPVMAEAHSSNPYRVASPVVAMYTGLPTIVGWDWHQRQQRAVLPGSIVTDRINDVTSLFSTADVADTQKILEKYNVEYIYVGPLERALYHPDGIQKFERMAQLGLIEIVYQNEGVIIYEVTGGIDA